MFSTREGKIAIHVNKFPEEIKNFRRNQRALAIPQSVLDNVELAVSEDCKERLMCYRAIDYIIELIGHLDAACRLEESDEKTTQLKYILSAMRQHNIIYKHYVNELCARRTNS